MGDFGWVDVDTSESLTAARRLLRRSLSKPGDGVVARYVNRPISAGLLTPMLLRFFPSVTPNQVSLLGLIVAIAAAFTFGLGVPILAAAGVMLASLLDGCDGEVARLKRVASPVGTFVDAVLDRYADAFMLTGAGYYTFRVRHRLGVVRRPLECGRRDRHPPGRFRGSHGQLHLGEVGRGPRASLPRAVDCCGPGPRTFACSSSSSEGYSPGSIP